VLITIIKNDGSYGVTDFILDNCSIVDETNWKCRDTNGLPKTASFYQQKDYAMIHGRYYHSLTGGGPPDFYTSSISGLTFLKLHYGFIGMSAALTATGYSAQAINEARMRCIREDTAVRSSEDWWCGPCYEQGACRHSPTRQ
jgi:hypothetical protein